MPRDFDRIDNKKTNRIHGQYDNIEDVKLSNYQTEYTNEVPIGKIRHPHNLNKDTKKLEKDRLDQLLKSFRSESRTIFGYVDEQSGKLIIIVPEGDPLPTDENITIDNDELLISFVEFDDTFQLLKSPEYRKQLDVDDAARTTYFLQLLAKFYTNEPGTVEYSADEAGARLGITASPNSESPHSTFVEFSKFNVGLKLRDNNLSEEALKTIDEIDSWVAKYRNLTTIKDALYVDGRDIPLEEVTPNTTVALKEVSSREFIDRKRQYEEADPLFVINEFDKFFKVALKEMEELWLLCREWLDNDELIDQAFEEMVEYEPIVVKKLQKQSIKRFTHLKELEREMELRTEIATVRLTQRETVPLSDRIANTRLIEKPVKQEDVLKILEKNLSEIEPETKKQKIPKVIFEPAEKPKPKTKKKTRRRRQKDRKKINLVEKPSKARKSIKKHNLNDEDYEIRIDGNTFSAYGEDDEVARTIVGSLPNEGGEIEDVHIEEDQFGNERHTAITIKQSDDEDDEVIYFINEREKNLD